MHKYLEFETPTKLVTLTISGEEPSCKHVLDQTMRSSVNAALACGRPLLARGEPGLGKSQLARAVACELNRAFLSFVVDSRTEHRDLLWRFDAVKRLALAQMAPHLARFRDEAVLEEALAEKNFVLPGPLWWALNWRNALSAAVVAASSGSTRDNSEMTESEVEKLIETSETPLRNPHNRQCKEQGWVLLIDEIDKAETDVPNGLLEVLGSTQFTPYGSVTPVTPLSIPPLIVITTNEDRSLPPAFVRRCVVLHLQLPEGKNEMIKFLAERGMAHFEGLTTPEVLTIAAERLHEERERAKLRRLKPLPGQAEYLDLLRAVIHLRPGNMTKQIALLEELKQYILVKSPGS